MNLKELRDAIDEVDAKLLYLLNERAGYVVQVGAIKRNNQEAVCVPNREKTLLSRLSEMNQKSEGTLSEEMIHQLFQNVMDTMKSLQV